MARISLTMSYLLQKFTPPPFVMYMYVPTTFRYDKDEGESLGTRVGEACDSIIEHNHELHAPTFKSLIPKYYVQGFYHLCKDKQCSIILNSAFLNHRVDQFLPPHAIQYRNSRIIIECGI